MPASEIGQSDDRCSVTTGGESWQETLSQESGEQNLIWSLKNFGVSISRHGPELLMGTSTRRSLQSPWSSLYLKEDLPKVDRDSTQAENHDSPDEPKGGHD